MAERRLRPHEAPQRRPDAGSGSDSGRAGAECGVRGPRKDVLGTAIRLALLPLVAARLAFCIAVALPRALARGGGAGFFAEAVCYVFAFWVSAQLLYNCARAQFSDPGSCSKTKPTDGVTGQFELSLDVGEGRERVLYAPRWCDRCALWKPPRADHCSRCGLCVLRADRHSFILGNCVGANNHGHVLLAGTFAVLGLWSLLCLCFYEVFCVREAIVAGYLSIVEDFSRALASSTKYGTSKAIVDPTAALRAVALTVTGAVGLDVLAEIVVTVALLLLFLLDVGPAWHRAFLGLTKFEIIHPMKEYVQLQKSPDIYCPLGPGFYRRSWHENLADVFGAWPRPWLRALLPLRGSSPLDLSAAGAPPPGPEGAAALKSRIEEVASRSCELPTITAADVGIRRPLEPIIV